mgnify:CR=1 FL=1
MVYRHNPDVVARHLFDEHVIVPVAGNLARENRLFTLNDCGRRIWELLDGVRDDGEIVRILSARHPGAGRQVADDTRAFLDEMARLKLIEPTGRQSDTDQAS